MIKLIKYNIYRSFHQLSTYVIMGIMILASLISALDIFISAENVNNISTIVGNILGSGKDITFILTGCICGMLIGDDFSIGAYSLCVNNGYSRKKIILSRIISIFILISIMLGILILIAIVVSIISTGNYEFIQIIKLLPMILIFLIHFCLLNMFCILVCFIIKKKASCTVICIFLITIISSILGLLASLSDISAKIYMNSSFVLPYLIFAGEIKIENIIISTIVIIGVSALVLRLINKIFKKEELV